MTKSVWSRHSTHVCSNRTTKNNEPRGPTKVNIIHKRECLLLFPFLIEFTGEFIYLFFCFSISSTMRFREVVKTFEIESALLIFQVVRELRGIPPLELARVAAGPAGGQTAPRGRKRHRARRAAAVPPYRPACENCCQSSLELQTELPSARRPLQPSRVVRFGV